MVKAAIKREQSDACISYAEREQVRCETSMVKGQLEKVLKSCSPCKKRDIRYEKVHF
jgi:hypothetical protein